MKNAIIFLAFLASCGPVQDAPQDAAPTSGESLHDAGSPYPVDAVESRRNNGCSNIMGNLPNSRSKTYVDGDPVDPQILDELQDVNIGAKRKPFSRPRGPRFTVQGTWSAPAVVNDGLTKALVASTSVGASTGFLEIPFDDGDRITGVTFQVCGNGVTDTIFDLFLGTTAGGLISIASGGITDTNRTNAWATLSTLVVTPTVLTTGNTLYVQAIANASGYSIAQLVPTFDRL